MSIIYTDNNAKIFYVKERYTVGQEDWIKYTNHLGEEFTCLVEAFNARFKEADNEDQVLVSAEKQKWHNSQRCCG